MDGNATFTTETSRTTMNCAMHKMASANHLRDFDSGMRAPRQERTWDCHVQLMVARVYSGRFDEASSSRCARDDSSPKLMKAVESGPRSSSDRWSMTWRRALARCVGYARFSLSKPFSVSAA